MRPLLTSFEKLLSVPLDSLVIKLLDLEHCSDLLTFLPWDNRFQVAVVMPMDVQAYGKGLMDVRQIEYLFSIITPLTHNTETARSVIDGDGGSVHQNS